MRWREGQVVATHYRLIRCATEDAQVSVWTAEDRSTKRPLTIRLWKSPLRPAVLKQLRDETRARAAVQHPALVRTISVIEEGMGTGVVLEHVPGTTLEARLKAPEPPALGECLAILRSAVEGLEAAHAKQILHRDLSAAAILLPASTEARQPAARLTGFLFAADRAEGEGSALADTQALSAIALRLLQAARLGLDERSAQRIAAAQTPGALLHAAEELLADPTAPTPAPLRSGREAPPEPPKPAERPVPPAPKLRAAPAERPAPPERPVARDRLRPLPVEPALVPPPAPAPAAAAGVFDDLPTAPGRPSLVDDLITSLDAPALEPEVRAPEPSAPEGDPSAPLPPTASPSPSPPTPPSARFIPGMLAINRLALKDRAASAAPRIAGAWRGLALLTGLSAVVMLGLALDAQRLVPALLRAGSVLALSALAGASLLVAADRKIRVAVEALLASPPPLSFKAVSPDRRMLSPSLNERGPSQAVLARSTLRFLGGLPAGLRARSQPLRLELKLTSAASALLLPDGTWRRFPLRAAVDSTLIALGSSQDAAAALRRALTVLERAGGLEAETNGSVLAMTLRVPSRSGADLAKAAEAAVVAFAIAGGLLAEEDRRPGK